MGPITIVGPFPLRPKPIFCDPSPLPIKPRFVSFCNLQSLSQCRRRFSVLSGHGHHLNGESPSLLCSCKQSLRTLVLGLSRAMLYVCFLKSLGLVLMRPICRRCDAGHQSPLSKYFMPTSISTNFKNIPTIFPSRVWIKLPDYKLCVEFLNLLGRYGLFVREDPPVLLRYHINLSTPRRSFSLYQNLVRTFAKALLSEVLLVPTRLLSLAPLLTLLRLVTVTTFSPAALFVEELSTILDLTSAMAMVVRLVRGEWKRDEYGCYEHVAELDGLCLAVKIRERDTFAKVFTAVKERLSHRSEDEVELSYQWPQWIMGPDWQRANPIPILDDEDMTLFMAIRSDLEEVHLKVKIIRKMLGASTVNSHRSVLDMGNMTSETISDKYWNSSETRAAWDSAVTRMLYGIVSGNSVTGDVGLAKYGAGPHIVRGGGITIRENTGETGVGSVAPRTLTQGHPSATAKGKERILDEESINDLEFAVWRKNQQEVMLREMEEREIRLAGSMVGQLVTTPAKATDNDVRGQTSSNPEEAIRLTLGNAAPVADVVSVVALSSTNSTFKTPSNSISFSSEDLMDEDEVSSNNCLARIGEDEVAHYYSDPDGPLCMAPMNTPKISRVNNIVRGEIVATEAQVNELNTHVRRRLADIYLKETLVPTVLYDRDAPPYFDDPGEEDYLHRALKDADYEGDDIFIGRLFKNKEDCATKLAIHAIRRKFNFITVKSCPNIVLAVCVSHTCPWRVYATKLEDSERFEIKCATQQHTCSVDARGDFHKQVSTAVIGQLMRTKYLGVGKGRRPNELRKMLRDEFSLNVSYWKAWRTREIAMDNAMGSALGSYALIQPYFKLLMETNPNSLVAMDTEKDKKGVEGFRYLFFALDAAVKGYAYMRKVIVIDGTHMRGRYGGCLIAASAQDANFQVFPIAFGIVNSENDDAWTWFMERLTDAIPNDPDLVFVSDRHSSIYASMRKVYPMSSHAACVVHLKRNIVSIFKSEGLSFLVASAARAYRPSDFNRIFVEVRAMHPACADYLEGIGFEHWTRSHFVGDSDNKRRDPCRNNGRRPPHHPISEISVQGDDHARPGHGYTGTFPSDVGGGKLAPPYVRRPPGRPQKILKALLQMQDSGT
ncbi:MULE transposase domain [Arabidopsis thaliana x Arabidopsis arenosa]|nr:MULE transposase domain [Arabidopsis thaliana x Arabidopsis arenosa]